MRLSLANRGHPVPLVAAPTPESLKTPPPLVLVLKPRPTSPPLWAGGHGAEEGLHTHHILDALKIMILAVDNLQDALSGEAR